MCRDWRELAELIDRCYRPLVLLAAFTGLRWGELVALRASDVDLELGTVHVTRKFAELQNGRREPGPPKSAAGVPTVAMPQVLVRVLVEHLAEHPAVPRRAGVSWTEGCAVAAEQLSSLARSVVGACREGRPSGGFHFQDLQHTGNTLAAASGASTRELMHRMGHGTIRAALIYQHATSDRDREIAAALGARIQREAGEKWPGAAGQRLASC
jgi:integrase